MVVVSGLARVGAADDARRDSSATPNSSGEVRRWEVTGPWGGDVRTMVVAPDDADRLYLGTSDGQIFRSTDGAATWQRIKPGLDRRGLSVDEIIFDPRNTRTMYAGTWAVAQGSEDQGVFKSEDGGEHWELLKRTKGLSILAVAIAPSDSNLLIAGSKSGAYRSTDAGDSWQRITPEDNIELRNVNSVAIDPENIDNIYIGTHHLPWKTTDGGATWNQTGYKEIGMIDDTDIMGICVNSANPNLVYMNGCSGIYRSTNRGEKWFKIPGIPFSARRTYALLNHPADQNVIFAGTSEGLWRSKDNGKRWMLLTSKSVVLRAVVVHPDKPNRVLIATDDFGVRVSENLGDDFSDANTGFIHRHILAIMPDATERGRVLASVFHDGTAGSVFASADGGETWQPSSRGLGPRDVFAFYQVPDNPEVIYAGTNNGVFRSNDRGTTWSFVGVPQVKPVKPAKKPTKAVRRGAIGGAVGRYETVPAKRVASRSPQKKTKARSTKRAPKKKPVPTVNSGLLPNHVELTNQVDSIAGFVDSEGRRGLLAATFDGLYRTFDESRGWEKVIVSDGEAAGRVFSVSTHRDMPNKVFVGTRDGLFISYDGGASWERVIRGPSEVSIKAIAQDPRDPDLVLLGTNQFVFRSTNGGRTWVRRGGGLPSGDFTSVVINPANPDEVMLADYSRGGIYRSIDRGYSWERIDKELPSNRVWTLTFDPFDRDRVYAGSFSSGVYVLTIQRAARSGQ